MNLIRALVTAIVIVTPFALFGYVMLRLAASYRPGKKDDRSDD